MQSLTLTVMKVEDCKEGIERGFFKDSKHSQLEALYSCDARSGLF